jgi:hypothetical protein
VDSVDVALEDEHLALEVLDLVFELLDLGLQVGVVVLDELALATVVAVEGIDIGALKVVSGGGEG